MQRIIVTRHGQPDMEWREGENEFPPGDPGLTPLGREQARRLGRRLAETGFRGRIVSSPYRRAAETADWVAQVLGARFSVHPGFREVQRDMSAFNGRTLAGLAEEFSNLDADAPLPHPWWTEEFENIGDRVLDRVRPLMEELTAGDVPDVLLVGHGASVHAAMVWLMLEHDRPRLAARGPIWNCSYSEYAITDPPQCAKLVCTSHLDPEQVTSNHMRPGHGELAAWSALPMPDQSAA